MANPDQIEINRIIIDLSSTISAFIIGIIIVKKLTFFYQLLLLQVIVYLIIESIVSYMAIISDVPYLNGWLYNIQLPIETALLLFAASTYFSSNISKQILLIFYGFIFLVYLADIFFMKFTTMAYHALIAESLLITGSYITILYFQFLKRTKSQLDISIIIASIGIILYFSCIIPDICLVPVLEKINPSLNKELFTYVVVMLAAIRYLCIAIAFFMIGKTRTFPTTKIIN